MQVSHGAEKEAAVKEEEQRPIKSDRQYRKHSRERERERFHRDRDRLSMMSKGCMLWSGYCINIALYVSTVAGGAMYHNV